MATIKAKTKIGGIEEIFGPEVFFGLLGWTDKKFDNEVIRFKISEKQSYVLERLGNGIYTGRISDVARAAVGLGVLIEAYQKGREPIIMKKILMSTRIGDSVEKHTEKIIDRIITHLNFSSDEVLNDLKNMICRHGDNELGRYLWSKIQSEYNYGHKISHQPKFRDIKKRVSNISWGCIPLKDDERFKLQRSSENVAITFRCTERIITLMNSINDEFSHFSKAKFTRGIFIKGLYVLAKWYQDNNKTVADWYNMARLIGELKILKCKDY